MILTVARQELPRTTAGTQGFQAQHQACSKAKSVSSQGHSACRTGTTDTAHWADRTDDRIKVQNTSTNKTLLTLVTRNKR